MRGPWRSHGRRRASLSRRANRASSGLEGGVRKRLGLDGMAGREADYGRRAIRLARGESLACASPRAAHPRGFMGSSIMPASAIACRFALIALGLASLAPAAPAATKGIWITRDEIMALPMSGPAWAALKKQADLPAGTPVLSSQDQNNNVYVLAKALVYVRTGIPGYRDSVVRACMAAIGTEAGGRTLALGRELEAYVVSADLVGLDPADDAVFRA